MNEPEAIRPPKIGGVHPSWFSAPDNHYWIYNFGAAGNVVVGLIRGPGSDSWLAIYLPRVGGTLEGFPMPSPTKALFPLVDAMANESRRWLNVNQDITSALKTKMGMK